jgi:Skp family chaperone for outer membrane proteins
MASRLVVLCAVFCILGALAAMFLPTLWSQQEQPRSLNVAVVSLRDIFANAQEWKDFQTAVSMDKKKTDDDLKKMESDVRELWEQYKLLDEDSDLRREKREEALKLSAVHDSRMEEWNKRTERRMNILTIEFYNKIRDEVDKYAAANGYDVVLKTETPKLDPKTEDAPLRSINVRTVLYGGGLKDISQDIAAALNDRYAKESKNK